MAAKLYSKPVRFLVFVLFIIYTLIVIKAVIIKYQMPWVMDVIDNPSLLDVKGNIESGLKSGNFVPFKTIQLYINAYYQQTVALGSIFDNLIGNIVVLIPFGIMVPLLIKKARNIMLTLLLGLMYILAIEGIQLITGLGVFDVDDIILNMTGVFIGYLLIRVLLSSTHR